MSTLAQIGVEVVQFSLQPLPLSPRASPPGSPLSTSDSASLTTPLTSGQTIDYSYFATTSNLQRLTMERLQDWMHGSSRSEAHIIKLNVGGHLFVSTLETLTADKSSRLAKIVEKPIMLDGAVFIDRDGTHFRHILNFLRSGVLNIKPDLTLCNELLVEADYYEIQGLKDLIQVTLPKDPSSATQEARRWREKAEGLEQQLVKLQEELKQLKAS
jgi:hypothetical protein